MMHKAWCSTEEVPYCFPRPSIKFQGHKGQKIDDLDQIWARLQGRSQLSNPSDLPCFTKLCVSYSFASVCIYLVRPSPVNALQSTGHRTSFYARGKGPAVDRETVFLYLGVTIGAQWAVDSAIGTGFYKLLSVFAKLYPPHMPQIYMPTIGNHRKNSKIAPISHYLVPTSTGKALALVVSYAIFSAEDTRHRDTGYPVCSTS